jgi:hypothetical protein
MLMESIGEDFVPLCPADGVCDKYAQVLLLLRGFFDGTVHIVGHNSCWSNSYVFYGTVHIVG